MKIAKIKALLSKEVSFFMVMPAVLWQVLFFYIPLFFIICLSFVKSHDSSSITFTLDHYRGIFASVYGKVIFRSLVVAFINALACLIIAYPMAYYLALKVKRFTNFLIFLIVLPFWTSFVVHVFSWYFILDNNGIINTLFMKIGLISQPISLLNNIFAILLVMIYCYVPFMIMPIYTALEKFNVTLLEASADLGATPAYTFFHVTIPLTMSGIKTGFFLVFVPSFGEFVIPALLGGGKTMFVGSLVYHYFLVARNTLTGAAFTCFSCLILIVVATIIALIFNKIVPDARRGVK